MLVKIGHEFFQTCINVLSVQKFLEPRIADFDKMPLKELKL